MYHFKTFCINKRNYIFRDFPHSHTILVPNVDVLLRLVLLSMVLSWVSNCIFFYYNGCDSALCNGNSLYESNISILRFPTWTFKGCVWQRWWHGILWNIFTGYWCCQILSNLNAWRISITVSIFNVHNFNDSWSVPFIYSLFVIAFDRMWFELFWN